MAFRVYLDDGEGNEPVKVFDTGSSSLTTTAVLRELQVGHSYVITVRAVNELGESDPSNELTIHAGTVPSKIESLVWEHSTSTSITVRWELPESNGGLSLTKFTLYSDFGQTGTYTPVEILDTFTRTYTFSGKTEGQLVDFQITASNINGEGQRSNVLSVYVSDVPNAPDQPTEQLISQLQDGSI